MKDDKFKKLSDNETGKISEGGISHETKAMGMKAYENYGPKGDFQKITILRPLENHVPVNNEEQKQLESDHTIEKINHLRKINKLLDIIKLKK